MFIAMYEFVVKSGCEDQFMSTWPKATQGIYLYKGSLGSRLHRDKSGAFIAYAQWPDEKTYRKAADIFMSEEYEVKRRQMLDSLNLEASNVLYEMDVEIDYLQHRTFQA